MAAGTASREPMVRDAIARACGGRVGDECVERDSGVHTPWRCHRLPTGGYFLWMLLQISAISSRIAALVNVPGSPVAHDHCALPSLILTSTSHAVPSGGVRS